MEGEAEGWFETCYPTAHTAFTSASATARVLLVLLVQTEWVELINLFPGCQGVGFGRLQEAEETIVGQKSEPDVGAAAGQEVEADVGHAVEWRLGEYASKTSTGVVGLKRIFPPDLKFVVAADGGEELAKSGIDPLDLSAPRV